MAKNIQIQKSVRGEPLPDFLVRLKGVQAVVRDRAFEIRAAATVQLRLHEAEGKAQIPVAKKVNQFAWRVELYDPVDLSSNGVNRGSAAKFIEGGREPYVVRTAWKTRRGRLRFPGQVYGGMDALEIMAKAVAIVANQHRSEFR